MRFACADEVKGNRGFRSALSVMLGISTGSWHFRIQEPHLYNSDVIDHAYKFLKPLSDSR